MLIYGRYYLERHNKSHMWKFLVNTEFTCWENTCLGMLGGIWTNNLCHSGANVLKVLGSNPIQYAWGLFCSQDSEKYWLSIVYTHQCMDKNRMIFFIPDANLNKGIVYFTTMPREDDDSFKHQLITWLGIRHRYSIHCLFSRSQNPGHPAFKRNTSETGFTMTLK